MTKSALRAKYKTLRQELTQDEIDDKSLAIANRMLQLNICRINSVSTSFCSSIVRYK